MQDLCYRLALEVRADSLEYSANLELEAKTLPRSLTLDSVGHRVRAVVADGSSVPFETGPDGEHLSLPSIPPGARTLRIEYTGTIDDPGLRGFYVSPLGPGRIYTTYFEPAGARRLLPCLDRPDEKAVFELTVTAPRGTTVISNTAVARSEILEGNRQRVRFEPTPRMSTYLLYVGIGPFEELRGEGRSPQVIVATAPGRSRDAQFSVAQGERAVAYFAEYYRQPYPLPKLHLIAVPQFGTGAMENWGAIAFQEYLLLVNDRSSISAKMRSLEVICHEIAHQWFGNLVTMRWWNDLWLNESFASLVAVEASDSLAPEWGAWDDFLGQRYSNALLWDALPHTHPIRVDVSDPMHIRQIFDEISYGKGASVLRMAEAYVGREAFRRGVSQYLADHRWGNAESADLWRAVGQASAEPVERVFGQWVDRPGYPVVEASVNGSTLHLKQRRFVLLGERGTVTPWPIPLRVRDGETVHRRLFETESTAIEGISGCPIVNPGRAGFYRVRYEAKLLARLLENFEGLPPIDRWGLLADSRALFLAGAVDLSELLGVLRLLERETDPFVLSEGLDQFRTLYPVVHRIPAWESALRAVVTAQSERLGWGAAVGETDRVRALRESFALARVRLDPGFGAQLAGKQREIESLEPEQVRPVLWAYAARAGPAERADLLAGLAASSSPERSRAIASALGMLPRDEWVRDAVELLLSGKMMLGVWIELYGTALVGNPDRSAALWGFLNERIAPVLKLLAGTGTQGVLMQLSVPFVGLDRAEEVSAWAQRTEFPESARAVTKGLDLLAVYRRAIEHGRPRGSSHRPPGEGTASAK